MPSPAIAIMPTTPANTFDNWGHQSERMMRVQQRMLDGMMNIVKLEVQFGQDFVASRLALLTSGSETRPPTTGFVMEELDRSLTAMRKIGQEVQLTMSETAKILGEVLETQNS